MSQQGRRKGRSELRRINPQAAGIDIGSASHWVAIDPSLSEHPVREFPAYTTGLRALADWLIEHGVKTVAMESTGVYWVALFEVLRQISERNINMRKIHSWPGGAEGWEYLFFVELTGHVTDRMLVTALEEMKSKCKMLKVIGSYPV